MGEPDIDERKMQFLYFDGDALVFMDLETYDQTPFGADVVGVSRNYLTENLEVEVLPSVATVRAAAERVLAY